MSRQNPGIQSFYACGEQKEETAPILEKLESQFRKGLPPFLLVGVGADWERDLTPWPAPAAFRGSKKIFLAAQNSIGRILPNILSLLWINVSAPFQVRLSLPCAATRWVDCQHCMPFISIRNLGWRPVYPVPSGTKTGSLLWKNIPAYPQARVYLSLGRAEEKIPASADAKNWRLHPYRAVSFIRQLGRSIPLVWNDGGHYTQIGLRKEQALVWLAMQIKNGI